MSLITFEEAVDHLHLSIEAGSPPDPIERDVRRKMAAAEDIILNYLQQAGGSPPAWDETTVPPRVRAAILLQLGELWRFRGDDGQGPAQTEGDLSPVITNLLRRDRRLTLA